MTILLILGRTTRITRQEYLDGEIKALLLPNKEYSIIVKSENDISNCRVTHLPYKDKDGNTVKDKYGSGISDGIKYTYKTSVISGITNVSEVVLLYSVKNHSDVEVTLVEGKAAHSLYTHEVQMEIAVGQKLYPGWWATIETLELESENVSISVANNSIAKKETPTGLNVIGVSPGTTELTITSKISGISDTIEVKVVPQHHYEGSGKSDDPYLVKTPSDMYYMRQRLGASYKQVGNIDLSTVSWKPIGSYYNKFTGRFDGDGHTISNVHIKEMANKPCHDYGLFGVASAGYFTKVNIDGFRITRPDGVTKKASRAGSLLGASEWSTLYLCNSTNVSIGEGDQLGGLIGMAWGGSSFWTSKLTYCSATNVDLKGTSNIGGLIGVTGGVRSEISDSYAIGKAEAEWHFLGGIIGGVNVEVNTDLDVAYCYAVMDLKCPGDTGGIIGSPDSALENAAVRNCYYSSSLAGDASLGGGYGVPTGAMRSRMTFEYWNFETIWAIYSGGFPFIHLRPAAIYCTSMPLPIGIRKMKQV